MHCTLCSKGNPCINHEYARSVRKIHNENPDFPMGCKRCRYRCRNEAVLVSGQAFCSEHLHLFLEDLFLEGGFKEIFWTDEKERGEDKHGQGQG